MAAVSNGSACATWGRWTGTTWRRLAAAYLRHGDRRDLLHEQGLDGLGMAAAIRAHLRRA